LTRKQLLLIVASAILTSLSFHPIGLHFLAWFGLVPLLFAIENIKPSFAFKSGIIFGFLFSLFSLFWLVFLQIEINIKILLLFGLILMFLYFGLYYGTGLLIANKIGLWFLPFILAGLEFIRGIGELGFPWLSFGYSQARYPLVIQQAAIYGIYGLSFWIVLINIIVYKLIKLRKAEYYVMFIIMFGLPLLYGVLRVKEPGGEFISVGVVQPNIDPNLKFTKAMREQTFNRLIYLSEKGGKITHEKTDKPFDIIIWPETAIPLFLQFSGKYQECVYELSDRINTPIFTGTPIYDFENREIYNGAVLIEPKKGITQMYKKIHLVPFGEHIPFDNYIPLFKKIDVGGGDYASGKEYKIFKSKGLKFSCLICFESIFPELSRAFVKDGADLLINITNDGWFGKISGPQQHSDMAILRTVENGVPLARSANTGISMIVDKYGRILVETGLFKEDFISSRVSIKHERTIYQIIGHIFPIISLLFVTVVLVCRIRIRKKNKRVI
jgi:apolipoprotein N-acyltransferase